MLVVFFYVLSCHSFFIGAVSQDQETNIKYMIFMEIRWIEIVNPYKFISREILRICKIVRHLHLFGTRSSTILSLMRCAQSAWTQNHYLWQTAAITSMQSVYIVGLITDPIVLTATKKPTRNHWKDGALSATKYYYQ